MLKITKYYKTIFLGFLQSSVASTETQSIVDRLSDSVNKESFMRNNLDEISSYLDTLDSNKDGTIIMGHINNPKLTELFKELEIKPEQLQHGITLNELKGRLIEYKIQKVETIGTTIIETYNLKEVVNINQILSSKVSLKKGVKNKRSVGALQNFLINKGFLTGKVDGNFGELTKQALIKFQKFKHFKVTDGVLTVKKSKNGKYFSTMQAIINENGDGRMINVPVISKEVITTSKKANESIDTNIDKIKISKDFYKALEAREDGGNRGDILSDMGSILGILREIFGKNNASEYFDKLNIEGKFKGAFDKVNDPKMQEKFNKGYKYLVKDISTRNSSLILYGFRDLLMVVFAGVPLFDVRLNFAKRLEGSGVDMNRALLFTKWAKSGMKQSFEKYEKEVGPTLNTGENLDRDLNKLKATVSAYIRTHHADKVKNGKVTKELIAQLRKTDTKLDELITTYINDRFIPDAEILLSGGFNVFEYFFDEKYNEIKELINELNGGGIKIKTTILAKKKVGTYKSPRDVFLLKNNGKFYLHIGSEYKEFTDKKPSSKEIESAIIEYNKLSLVTHGKIKPTTSSIKYSPYSIKGRRIIKEAKRKNQVPNLIIQQEVYSWYRLNLDNSKNEIYQSKKERLNTAHKIMDEFRKQNTKSKDNIVGAGKLDGHIESVEDRLEYYGILNKKNSKFLKEAINILKAGKDIPDEVRQNFGLINKYNSTEGFLNAYSALPKEVKDKIKQLDHSKLIPEKYISKLQELSNISDVRDALIAIKQGPKAYEKYRLIDLESRLHIVPKEHRIDAGKFKYGVRILSKEEFNKPYIELQAEYKIRYEELHRKYPKNKEIKQEFKNPKTFKDIYSFDKPNTSDKTADYDIYLDKLAKTGPNKSDEINGKYWSTMDYQERGLIEQGIYDITGEQLTEAIKTKGKDVKIEDYFDNPGNFINTARQAGTKHDKKTTFRKLAEERGDKYIKHVSIDRSYSVLTKSGENIKIDITYDIFDRPECQNIYVLPNSKSIRKIITTLKQNNTISILKTGSIPILPSMFNGFLKTGGNGGNGGLKGIGNSNANNGNVVGPGNGAGPLL